MFTLPPAPPPLPPRATPACGQLLAAVRDFRSSHSDFEKGALNVGVLFPGLVRGDLGADGPQSRRNWRSPTNQASRNCQRILASAASTTLTVRR